MSCWMCFFEGFSALAEEPACCAALAFATLVPDGFDGRSSAQTERAVHTQITIAASNSRMPTFLPRYGNTSRDMVNLAGAISHVHHIEIGQFETGKFAASMRWLV